MLTLLVVLQLWSIVHISVVLLKLLRENCQTPRTRTRTLTWRIIGVLWAEEMAKKVIFKWHFQDWMYFYVFRRFLSPQ